jgi:hypothetical protein
MTWSFSSISSPVELTYTQSVGWTPDVAMLRFNPQSASIATSGTISMYWDGVTITLPNCVVDLGTLRLTDDGRYMLLKVLDRRELWRNNAGISGEYNILRAGVVTRTKTLRQLGSLLMVALGEATADVSALPTDIYPPVSWQCEDIVEAADALLSEYGYTVALGFGSEAVTIVRLGTGATLSTTDRFVGSDTIDPKLIPRYVRNCFATSLAQVRLKLEAVGLDTDGSWKPINSLSFAPSGTWENTVPVSLGDAADALTDDEAAAAKAYVRSAYRVMGFADGTWDPPDGSGTVSGLKDILPLQSRLLETEDLRSDNSYIPYRVYGKYRKSERELANPVVPGSETTAIGDPVVGRQYHLDGENGVLIFEEPVYWIDTAGTPVFKPAELYLECVIAVRNSTTNQYNNYVYDVSVDAAGVGYHKIKHEQYATTIVQYNTSHVVTGTTTNQSALDDIGDAAAVAAAGMFVTSASQFVAYNKPKLTLRCDGAILQVQHVLTCGEHGHAVNRTSASRNYEFDRGVPSRAQRVAHLRAMQAGASSRMERVRTARVRNTDD